MVLRCYFYIFSGRQLKLIFSLATLSPEKINQKDEILLSRKWQTNPLRGISSRTQSFPTESQLHRFFQLKMRKKMQKKKKLFALKFSPHPFELYLKMFIKSVKYTYFNIMLLGMLIKPKLPTTSKYGQLVFDNYYFLVPLSNLINRMNSDNLSTILEFQWLSLFLKPLYLGITSIYHKNTM